MGQISTLILSSFFGSMVHRKNLEGRLVGEALLEHFGDKVFIEMVRIQCEVSTAC